MWIVWILQGLGVFVGLLMMGMGILGFAAIVSALKKDGIRSAWDQENMLEMALQSLILIVLGLALYFVVSGTML